MSTTTRRPEPAARVTRGPEPEQPPRIPRWLARLLRDLAAADERPAPPRAWGRVDW